VIIVSGPSGAGKGTLIRRVQAVFPFVRTAISATTRPMRPGEQNGREYHFLTEDEFLLHVQEGEFLEHVMYAGNRYGTLRQEVEHHLRNGDSVILEIELRGARALRDALPDAVTIFIEPPSMDELIRRLRARDTEAEADIQARLAESLVELGARQEFNYQIRNDDLDTAAAEMARIVDVVTRSD
jgi:guanylate kinase